MPFRFGAPASSMFDVAHCVLGSSLVVRGVRSTFGSFCECLDAILTCIVLTWLDFRLDTTSTRLSNASLRHRGHKHLPYRLLYLLGA